MTQERKVRGGILLAFRSMIEVGEALLLLIIGFQSETFLLAAELVGSQGRGEEINKWFSLLLGQAKIIWRRLSPSKKVYSVVSQIGVKRMGKVVKKVSRSGDYTFNRYPTPGSVWI